MFLAAAGAILSEQRWDLFTESESVKEVLCQVISSHPTDDDFSWFATMLCSSCVSSSPSGYFLHGSLTIPTIFPFMSLSSFLSRYWGNLDGIFANLQTWTRSIDCILLPWASLLYTAYHILCNEMSVTTSINMTQWNGKSLSTMFPCEPQLLPITRRTNIQHDGNTYINY